MAVGASPLSLVLSKLNSLNPLPTGYGENNLAYFAPNIYILRYILQNQYGDIVRGKELTEILIRNIIRGFDNQIQFYHSKTGGFSNLGESYGDRENIWLTASVFQTFSEAAKLPLAALSGESLNIYSILSKGFDYLASQQDEKGCFLDVRYSNEKDFESQLLLTAHVISALNTACAETKQSKCEEYEKVIKSASKCLERMIEMQHISKLSTYILARVVYALKVCCNFSNCFKYKRILSELIHRAESGGTVMWWRASVGVNKLKDLETTAFAILSIEPDTFSQKDRLGILRWIIQQRNEIEDFYSYRDSVIMIRALIELSEGFPSSFSEAFITLKSKPKNIFNSRFEMDKRALYSAQLLEAGPHNTTDILEVDLGIMASKFVCILTDFTTIYSVHEPLKVNSPFELEMYIDQDGKNCNVTCTTVKKKICVRSIESRMFVLTIQLPTGWMLKVEELNSTSSNEGIHKFELDSKKQEVNAYFISTNDNKSIDTTTCFTANFYHNMVVENIQPGLMTVRDLRNPEKIVQKYLKLNSCHVNLNSNESLILISDKVKRSPNALLNLLNSSLCHNNLTLNIFKPFPKYTAGNLLFGSVYSFQSNDTFVSWNTTVHFSGDFEKHNGAENGMAFFSSLSLFNLQQIYLHEENLIPIKYILNNILNYKSNHAAPSFQCSNSPSFSLFNQIFTRTTIL